MGVNSLPKTIIRQRRDCDLNPGPSATQSSTLTTRLPSHQAFYVAVNTTLLAFAAERRAAVDVDRKAAAPAADAPCSNQSISPVRWAHSSKPAAPRGCGAIWDGQTDRQTDGHRIVTLTLPQTTRTVPIIH